MKNMNLLKKFGAIAICCALTTLAPGCSEETQREAAEAMEASGEAARSAAKDAAANAEAVADDVNDMVNGEGSDVDATE